MNKESLDRNISKVFWVWVVLTLLFLLIASWNLPTPHRKVSSDLEDDAMLQQWYGTINEEYLANTLPKNTQVRWGDLASKHDMGLTVQRADGSYLIVIDRATNPTWSSALLTEYHEICHIVVPITTLDNDHGPKFQACMLGFAKAGAFKDLW